MAGGPGQHECTDHYPWSVLSCHSTLVVYVYMYDNHYYYLHLGCHFALLDFIHRRIVNVIVDVNVMMTL